MMMYKHTKTLRLPEIKIQFGKLKFSFPIVPSTENSTL